MRRRYNVKPSKPASLLAGIVGVAFVLLGIFVIIPTFGAFGLLWTLVAGGIGGIHLYNFFSEKGAGLYRIDVEDDSVSNNNTANNEEVDFDVKLRKLQKLYDDRIITKEEYEKKRKELLDSDW